MKLGLPFPPLQAVLAGIILSNILPYLETIYNLPSLWRQNQFDSVSTDALAEVGKDSGEGWKEGTRTNRRDQGEGP